MNGQMSFLQWNKLTKQKKKKFQMFLPIDKNNRIIITKYKKHFEINTTQNNYTHDIRLRVINIIIKCYGK